MSTSPRAKSTLEQWRIFQAVVEHGGYAQAADKLSKSQSSLNHAVAKLQSQLGIQLLEVVGRKAQLTEAGEVMLRRSKLLTEGVHELEQLATNLGQGWEPQLTIAYDKVVSRALVIKALKRFLPECRGTRVRMMETVLSGTVEAIEQARADLVITATLPQGVLGEFFGYIDLIPITHCSHPLASVDQSLSIDELSQELQLVVAETGSKPLPSRGWLLAEQRWTVESFEAVLEVLAQGIGFAWVPNHLADAQVATGNYKVLKVQGGAITRLSAYLVAPQPEQLGPAGQRLKQLLLEQSS